MKPFTTIAVVVFVVVSVVHLLRLSLGWAVTVNDAIVPMWVSVFGCVGPVVLAVMLYRESCKPGGK